MPWSKPPPPSPAGNTKHLLGTTGLLDIVTQLNTQDPGELAATLLARVRAYAQSDLDDDATIMLLKLNTIPPVRGSIAKGLETTARLAKEFAQSLFTRAGFAWPEVRKDNLLGSYFDRFNKK
jgi:hypothetical protein